MNERGNEQTNERIRKRTDRRNGGETNERMNRLLQSLNNFIKGQLIITVTSISVFCSVDTIVVGLVFVAGVD